MYSAAISSRKQKKWHHRISHRHGLESWGGGRCCLRIKNHLVSVRKIFELRPKSAQACCIVYIWLNPSTAGACIFLYTKRKRFSYRICHGQQGSTAQIGDKISHPLHRWLLRACDGLASMLQQHFPLELHTCNERCRSKRM